MENACVGVPTTTTTTSQKDSLNETKILDVPGTTTFRKLSADVKVSAWSRPCRRFVIRSIRPLRCFSSLSFSRELLTDAFFVRVLQNQGLERSSSLLHQIVYHIME